MPATRPLGTDERMVPPKPAGYPAAWRVEIASDTDSPVTLGMTPGGVPVPCVNLAEGSVNGTIGWPWRAPFMMPFQIGAAIAAPCMTG